MRMATTTVVCFFVLLASVAFGFEEWGYDTSLPNGPDHWVEVYPYCGGQAQSPVDIIDSATVAFSPGSLVFKNYDTVPTTRYTIVNVGHSVQVKPNVNDISVSGGGLPGTYTLEQFHFHWGKDIPTGSEHLIDSTSRPLEVHLVHYNSDKYDSVASAVAAADPQGVAVIGVFASVEIGTQSATLRYIANNLVNVSHKGDQSTLDPFAIQTILPADKATFYRYQGSLTTPGCNEVVIWTVFAQPIYSTKYIINKFDALFMNEAGVLPDEPLDQNYRPPQPLNGRLVYKST